MELYWNTVSFLTVFCQKFYYVLISGSHAAAVLES